MALRKIKLGELLEQSDERNTKETFGLDSIRGISTQKVFIDTKANMDGVSLKGYKIVPPNCFSYVPDTSRRGEKISIAFNNSKETYLVSSISIVFKAKSELIDPWYLFMFFNRPEFDRYSRYHSFGSAREPFNWEDMCGVEIELPDLETQKKFVNVYLGMLENQKAYETGLEDLKLVCDGFIESLKNKTITAPIGKFIHSYSLKNKDKSITEVVGLSTSKEFREAQSRVNKNELGGYKIVHDGDFAFVPTTDTWKCLAFAVNHYGKDVVVSPIYEVFTVDKSVLDPDYLSMWFKRKEFDRYARYNSWGSARENFTFDEMKNVTIPIPDMKIQQAIVQIYMALGERKKILQELRDQTKHICPILIKGSIEEAKEA